MIPQKKHKTVWKYPTICQYDKLICFHELQFKECFYQHSDLTLMHKRWGDLRHDFRRQLEKQMKQQPSECKFGINCMFLARDLCRKKHSKFDEEWGRRIRAHLKKTKCPNEEDCSDNLCFYLHETKVNTIVEHEGKKMNALLAKQEKQ